MKTYKDLVHNLSENRFSDLKQGQKLDKNSNTVGASRLRYESDDFRLYSAYRGGKRDFWRVTDTDDIILGSGLGAKSAMKAAKLKAAEQRDLMSEKNRIVGIYKSDKVNRTWVYAHEAGKSIEDHEEALAFAKSLNGKIRKADSLGNILEGKMNVYSVNEEQEPTYTFYATKRLGSGPEGKILLHPKKKSFSSERDAANYIKEKHKGNGSIHKVHTKTGKIVSNRTLEWGQAGYKSDVEPGDPKKLSDLKN